MDTMLDVSREVKKILSDSISVFEIVLVVSKLLLIVMKAVDVHFIVLIRWEPVLAKDVLQNLWKAVISVHIDDNYYVEKSKGVGIE